LGRFDDRDEELNNRSKPVSNTLTILLFGIAIGFVMGALWGFYFFESTVPEAFAEPIKEISRPLGSVLGMSDSITVVLSSGTG